jgi:hypothetical protein
MLTALFAEWMNWIGDWSQLVTAVLAGEEVERPNEIPAEVAALLDLATLAASISRDGLMNPITVAKLPGGGYQIESGERRWLAYHMLFGFHGAAWQQIPARLVDGVNRWRQAAENNTRADLNAVGKARQFAVLLMELLGAEGQPFAPFTSFDDEQQFYAQVADGETFRIPRGRGELMLTAMGLKNPTQLRQYRALLRLPATVWQQADDENWEEKRIRMFTQMDTVTPVTVSAEVENVPVGTLSDDDAIPDLRPDSTEPPSPTADSGAGQGDTPRLKLPGDVKKAKTDTAYVLQRLSEKTIDALDMDERNQIASRAEDLATYWADVARKARG